MFMQNSLNLNRKCYDYQNHVIKIPIFFANPCNSNIKVDTLFSASFFTRLQKEHMVTNILLQHDENLSILQYLRYINYDFSIESVSRSVNGVVSDHCDYSQDERSCCRRQMS